MNRSTRARSRAWMLGPVAIALVAIVAPPGSSSAAPVPGSQGTDTSLAATDSQVVVAGRGRFADLRITVNQTADLNNQAVSITWTGGSPTRSGPGRFASNYLQIMQCWGDDDGTIPGNPGPPPEQCVQGAVGGNPSGPPAAIYANPEPLSRVMSVQGWANFNAAEGFFDSRTKFLWRPFRAVGGPVVDVPADPRFNVNVGGSYWQNPFFNEITTNEIPAARTGPDGSGAELFEVHTGLQSTGLGCGQRTQTLADGSKKIPRCWIVIVPRGNPVDENAGTPFDDPTIAAQRGITTSPLATSVWPNRIAIPIEFKPIDTACNLASVERRIAGNELIGPAVASWQPTLCATADLPPYSYAPVSDATARQIMSTLPAGAPGMVVVNRPLAATAVPAASPVVYAPLTLSGLVIGFNLERTPKPRAPAEAQQLGGVRVAELNLTPRLVAKLLTQSYKAQTAISAQDPGYPWAATNPSELVSDPDFLQFNPEFELYNPGDSRTLSGLQLPSGTSDAAQQVWEWVLSDPEAAAWLGGETDEWGMKVNPAYSTNASLNPNGGAFGDPAPNSFPKADPFCYQAPSIGTLVPAPLCGTDWMPYTRSFADSARIGRTASDGARIVINPFPASAATIWSRAVPQSIGSRAMLTLTDAPSAALYGLQVARLSRSGDNGAGRRFIAPDEAGLLAGAAAMTAKTEPSVLEPDSSKVAPDAYPLTAITYAAIRPLALDAQARSEYAAFLEYAAGPGQVRGVEVGQLPRGYVVLPAAISAQATAAATKVRTMTAPPAESAGPTTSSPPAPTAPSASGGASGGASSGASGGQPAAQPQRPQSSAPRPSSGGSSSAVTSPVEIVTPSSVPTSEVPTSSEVPASSVPANPTSAPPTTLPAAVVTPGLDLSLSRFFVVAFGVVALLAALAALEITKRTRRAGPSEDPIELQPMLDLQPTPKGA